MTAKAIRREFVRTYLKPALRAYGYQTNGHNWWKDRGDFFLVVNIQNARGNTKDDLRFWMNGGIALKTGLAHADRATYDEAATGLTGDAYLPAARQKEKQQADPLPGYEIVDDTDLQAFIPIFKSDLEDHLLQPLEQLKTLSDCLRFYENYGDCATALKASMQAAGIKA